MNLGKSIQVGGFVKITSDNDDAVYYKISDLKFDGVPGLITLTSTLTNEIKTIFVYPKSNQNLNNVYYMIGETVTIEFMESIELSTQNMFLTNIPDIDINILSNVDDKTLTALCQTNRYVNSMCKSDDLWRMKLDNFFVKKGIPNKIDSNKSLKQNYIELSKKFKWPYRYEGKPQLFGFKGSLIKGFYYNDGDDDDPEYIYNGGVPDLEQIYELYPEIRGKLRRGDILSDVDEGEYRSKGSFFYDGEGGLYETSSKFDDYGGPPDEFMAFTEFLPGYWDNLSTSDIGEESEFYWHSDDVVISFDVSLYDPSTVGKNEDGDYFVVTTNGMNHVVFYDPSDFMSRMEGLPETDEKVLPIVKKYDAIKFSKINYDTNKLVGIKNIGSVSRINS